MRFAAHSSLFPVGEFDAGVDGSDLVIPMINQAFYYLDLLEWPFDPSQFGPNQAKWAQIGPTPVAALTPDVVWTCCTTCGLRI